MPAFFSSYAAEKQYTDQTRKDIYRLILHKESWILKEHLDSASDAFMPFLKDDELDTWNWSVREVLDGIDYREIQLDQSERKEVIIHTHARTYCGSGGCSAHLLKLDGDEPRYIGTFFDTGKIIEPNFNKTDTLSSGFYDFAVQGRSTIDVYTYDTGKNKYRLK